MNVLSNESLTAETEKTSKLLDKQIEINADVLDVLRLQGDQLRILNKRIKALEEKNER